MSDITSGKIWVGGEKFEGWKANLMFSGATLSITGFASAALDNLASVAINASLISDTDNTHDLGSAAKEWKDLYIDGTANIDALVADTADINAGTVDAITSLTVANNVDIGNYTLTANGLTIDGTFTDGTASLVGGSLTSIKLGTLTSNGFVKTSGSDGTLSVDTNTYVVTGTALLLDQTSPQTLINGVPLMTTAVDGEGSQNQVVNKEYVDLAVSSLELTEFFHDAADALAGIYYIMTDTEDTAGTVVSAAGVPTGAAVNVFNFLTPDGKPGLDRLVDGVYDSHAHLSRSVNVNRDVTVYYELYKRASIGTGGAEALLGTSEVQAITTTPTAYNIHIALATELTILTTDRLLVKWYATVTGVGGDNPTVTMTTGAANNSHFLVKISSVDLATIYVPYTGAQSDVNLGTKVLTCTSAALTTPLLGTPTSGVATNITGLPAAAVLAGTFGTGAYTFDNTISGMTGIVLADNGTIGSASDTDVMTIDASGNTTFTVFPITPSAAPDANYEVANKKYVDDNAGGDVSKVGTPADSQVGVWTGDGTIEGDASLTYDRSNLQLTGDIGSTGTRITKGWFTDLEVTNAIAGSITGNAATVSTITTLAPDTATTQATQAGITTCANLTTVGTIGAGTWQGTTVAFNQGGTGLASWTQYLIPYAATTTSIGQIAIGTATHVLTSNGAGAAPTFQAAGGGGASTALDNLASVAINTSIISDTDSADDLGSSSKFWRLTYSDGYVFPATQAVSANANTLDDYEEGTWAASFVSAGGSVTIHTTYDVGTYTKIGRICHVSGYFQISSTSSPTGTLSISGLPFTSLSSTAVWPACTVYAQGLDATATTAIQGNFTRGSDDILLNRFVAGNFNNLGEEVDGTTGLFILSGTYVVS